MCTTGCVVANLSSSQLSLLCLTTEPLNFILSCMCVCVSVSVACVFVCAGSHRIIDTEFDDGLMVVDKGGWGAWFLSISLS